MRSLYWHADGARLLSGGEDGCAWLWHGSELAESKQLVRGRVWVDHVSFSPCGTRLVVAAGKNLTFADADGSRSIASEAHASSITGVAWRANSEQVLTSCYGGIQSVVVADRILIEPTGIGHPGGLIEELRSFERAGAVELKSVVALVDAARLDCFAGSNVERDQIEAADVLVLAKADVTSERDKQRFAAEASALFPPKRWIGWCSGAELAAVALDPPPAALAFCTPRPPPLHVEARLHASGHEHGINTSERTVSLGSGRAKAQSYLRIGPPWLRMACAARGEVQPRCHRARTPDATSACHRTPQSGAAHRRRALDARQCDRGRRARAAKRLAARQPH